MLCIRYGGLSGLPVAGSHACVLFLRRFLIQRSLTVQSYLCQHAVFFKVCPQSVSTTIAHSCVSAVDLHAFLHPPSFHDIAYRMDASISIIVA